MKSDLLVPTKNTIAAENAMHYLATRPKQEMVGLGLIYGKPGLGKTRWARRWAMQNGWIYLRLEAPMTCRAFLTELLSLLYYKLGWPEQTPKGSAARMLHDVKALLLRNESISIMVDEIDYAFGRKDLLGLIRDIADETYCMVVLVGMTDAKRHLMATNSHYFDRCNAFVEFVALDLADMNTYLRAVSEIELEPEVVSMIHKVSSGNLRKAVKWLRAIEAIGKSKRLTRISLRDCAGLRNDVEVAA